jgi:hypothetical protein
LTLIECLFENAAMGVLQAASPTEAGAPAGASAAAGAGALRAGALAGAGALAEAGAAARAGALRAGALAGADALAEAGAAGGAGMPAGAGTLAVLPALRELLPAGGLQRGSVVAAGGWSLLCVALIAAASTAGAWCAAVGLPQLGVGAAVGAGLDPDRLLLIAEPGAGWPQVVASLLEGCEIVLLRPPERPSAQLRRKLEAAVRRYRSVLVVAGDWEGAQTRFRIARQEWAGLGDGHGRLRARRVQVVADGRGAWSRHRMRWLWLPGPAGSVVAAAQSITGEESAAGELPVWSAAG